MHEGICKIEREEIPVLVSTLSRAFEKDETLRRLKRFPASRLRDFFSLACDFFFADQGSSTIGFWREGCLLGGALGIPSSWSVPPSILWRFFRRSWSIIGPASLPMVFNLLRAAWLSRPRLSLWRLLFLGVLPEARGQGIARLILEHIFFTRPAAQIQLEVEKENLPAFRLYSSEGFQVDRKYRLGGVEWLVMVKNLAQEQKPD